MEAIQGLDESYSKFLSNQKEQKEAIEIKAKRDFGIMFIKIFSNIENLPQFIFNNIGIDGCRINFLTCLDIRELKNMGATCTYLFEIVNMNFFWNKIGRQIDPNAGLNSKQKIKEHVLEINKYFQQEVCDLTPESRLVAEKLKQLIREVLSTESINNFRRADKLRHDYEILNYMSCFSKHVQNANNKYSIKVEDLTLISIEKEQANFMIGALKTKQILLLA